MECGWLWEKHYRNQPYRCQAQVNSIPGQHQNRKQPQHLWTAPRGERTFAGHSRQTGEEQRDMRQRLLWKRLCVYMGRWTSVPSGRDYRFVPKSIKASRAAWDALSWSEAQYGKHLLWQRLGHWENQGLAASCGYRNHKQHLHAYIQKSPAYSCWRDDWYILTLKNGLQKKEKVCSSTTHLNDKL